MEHSSHPLTRIQIPQSNLNLPSRIGHRNKQQIRIHSALWEGSEYHWHNRQGTTALKRATLNAETPSAVMVVMYLL